MRRRAGRPKTGDVRVDPLVWEPITPETRDEIALIVRHSYQSEAASTDRPAWSHFRIISSRDDAAVLATYPVRAPATADTRPSSSRQ